MENIHFYADFERSQISKCLVSNGMIQMFKDEKELQPYRQSYNKKNLFKTEEEAEKRMAFLKDLYYGNFTFKPFVKEEILINNLDKFKQIQSEIRERLSDFGNFEGIDFCDVSAGGIQIRGHHKEINGYTYGSQITIKYDFSNYLDCIENFVTMWKEQDTSTRVKGYQNFIADGEKYGWD